MVPLGLTPGRERAAEGAAPGVRAEPRGAAGEPGARGADEPDAALASAGGRPGGNTPRLGRGPTRSLLNPKGR